MIPLGVVTMPQKPVDAWPDEKIYNNARWHIQRSSMDSESWRYTRIADCHPEVLSRIRLESGEVVVVSSFITESSWYALTTRRILGAYNRRSVDVLATAVIKHDFDDFKSRRSQTEIVKFSIAGKWRNAELEYETGKASMAPIHYMRFWEKKYPILDKLKDNPYA